MKEKNNDPVEKLIRLTGPRPPVPDETTRRVRAGVHRHWRETVDAARRPRRIRTGLALAVAAVLLCTVGLVSWNRWGVPGNRASRGEVLAVTGSAPFQVGEKLAYGTFVATGPDGGVAIGLAPGQSIRLDSETSVHLKRRAILELKRGAVYVDSDGLGGPESSPLTIRTPLGAFREIGTQFEIRMEDEGVRARVREGRIAVKRESDELQLVAGRQMEITFRGEITQSEIDPASPEWGWIGGLTPMMAIDGRPAMEYLTWYARERGLQLEFQNADLVAEAASATLTGSIEGMTLEQSLDAVLPTCGMAYRIHDGTLTVIRQD